MQTVLNLKEKALEEQLQKLSEVVSRLNAEKERLQEFEEKLASVQDLLYKMYSSEEVIDFRKIEVFKNYLAKTASDIVQQKEIIENVDNLVKQQQQEVNKALKEKKIFDKLKEKESEKFYKEQEYKERTEIDDLTNSRYQGK